MALSIDFRGSVSFPPGYPSYRTLTLVLVGLTPTEYTSLRWTYAESSPERPFPLHAHIQFLAESGRVLVQYSKPVGITRRKLYLAHATARCHRSICKDVQQRRRSFRMDQGRRPPDAAQTNLL